MGAVHIQSITFWWRGVAEAEDDDREGETGIKSVRDCA
jgi:hypothetical protein